MATLKSSSERAKNFREGAAVNISKANGRTTSQRASDDSELHSHASRVTKAYSSSDAAQDTIHQSLRSGNKFTQARKAIQRSTGAALKAVNGVLANSTVTDLTTGVAQRLLWRSLLTLERATSSKEKDSYASAATSGINLPGSSIIGRLGSGSLPDPDPNKNADGPVRENWYSKQKASHQVKINRSNRTLTNQYASTDRSNQYSTGETLSEPVEDNQAYKAVNAKKETSRRYDPKGEYTSQLGKEAKPEAKANRVLIINTNAAKPELNSGHIYLQNRPMELDMAPKSDWAEIKSMGRNLPMYHFCSGQRILQFNTSWYIKGKPSDPDFDPYYVLRMCRTLEAWSMSNGYLAAPPILMIDWGESPFNNEVITNMFAGNLWILYSATYKLRDFHAMSGQWEKTGFDLRDTQNKVKFEDYGLLPFAATQELIFHQVSSTNLLYPEIINLPDMSVKDEHQ